MKIDSVWAGDRELRQVRALKNISIQSTVSQRITQITDVVVRT